MAIQTINEISRDILNEWSENARARYRDAVRPIYGATGKGDPDHIGSCILLEVDGEQFLLTAAHVLDHNQNTSLYLGGDELILLQFEALATIAPSGIEIKTMLILQSPVLILSRSQNCLVQCSSRSTTLVPMSALPKDVSIHVSATQIQRTSQSHTTAKILNR